MGGRLEQAPSRRGNPAFRFDAWMDASAIMRNAFGAEGLLLPPPQAGAAAHAAPGAPPPRAPPPAAALAGPPDAVLRHAPGAYDGASAPSATCVPLYHGQRLVVGRVRGRGVGVTCPHPAIAANHAAFVFDARTGLLTVTALTAAGWNGVVQTTPYSAQRAAPQMRHYDAISLGPPTRPESLGGPDVPFDPYRFLLLVRRRLAHPARLARDGDAEHAAPGPAGRAAGPRAAAAAATPDDAANGDRQRGATGSASLEDHPPGHTWVPRLGGSPAAPDSAAHATSEAPRGDARSKDRPRGAPLRASVGRLLRCCLTRPPPAPAAAPPPAAAGLCTAAAGLCAGAPPRPDSADEGPRTDHAGAPAVGRRSAFEDELRSARCGQCAGLLDPPTHELTPEFLWRLSPSVRHGSAALIQALSRRFLARATARATALANEPPAAATDSRGAYHGSRHPGPPEDEETPAIPPRPGRPPRRWRGRAPGRRTPGAICSLTGSCNTGGARLQASLAS